MTSNYLRLCRAAVRNLIEADRVLATPPAGLLGIVKVYEQNEFDPDNMSGPAISCYFMNQPSPIGGSMQRDDWRFPIVVGLKTTGVNTGAKAGPEPTDFLGAIYDIFHNRRPAGVPSGVYKCEIDPQGATATNEEKYQQLTAAVTVVLTARLNRRGP